MLELQSTVDLGTCSVTDVAQLGGAVYVACPTPAYIHSFNMTYLVLLSISSIPIDMIYNTVASADTDHRLYVSSLNGTVQNGKYGVWYFDTATRNVIQFTTGLSGISTLSLAPNGMIVCW